MIIWIASYPKSGNTYIRSFLSAYYFSNNGVFSFDLLKKIEQFPDIQFFDGFISNKEDAAKNWLPMQKKLLFNKNVKFLKTHSAYGAFDNYPFTSSEVTLGAIYIVRDPRNIILSLMNHFSLNEDKALEMLFDQNRGIKSEDSNYASYSFLSTWANHVKSWSNIKSFKTIFLKYEDLKDDQNKILQNLIHFINTLLNNNKGIDFQKFEKALETTKFDILKKKESESGFPEAVISKNQKKNVPFFNIGFHNDWKKNLSDVTVKKIENKFEKEMKLLGYIK